MGDLSRFEMDIDFGWDEPEKEVPPEEAAYGKYLEWKMTIERDPHDFNRDEVMWGESSDRGVPNEPDCPLTEDEKRLAGWWAKFIGDRHFMFKEYLPFC